MYLAHVILPQLWLWDHVDSGLAAPTGSPACCVPTAQTPRGVMALASSAATRLCDQMLAVLEVFLQSPQNSSGKKALALEILHDL